METKTSPPNNSGVTRLSLLCLLCATVCISGHTAAADDSIVLITRDEIFPRVQLIAINDESVQVRDETGADGGIRIVPVSQCVGFICRDVELQAPRPGVVTLVDGQQYPGEPVTVNGAEQNGQVLRWSHRWFGLMRFPLESISWIGLHSDAEPPRLRELDAVILANGDRLEGFLTEVGDELAVELEDDESVVRVPINRVAAVRLVNPRSPAAPGVRRLWIKNGTIADVRSVRLSDDQVFRFDLPAAAAKQDEFQLHFSHVAGVMFDAGALVPLASIDPHDIEGPPVRYLVPAPTVGAQAAPLGLRPITMRGPLTARYTQPENASRFVAGARLIDPTSAWADCEIVIYDDEREVFRARLNREQPDVEIVADLEGSELAIEITEGAHGPIEDRIVFERAMILSN